MMRRILSLCCSVLLACCCSVLLACCYSGLTLAAIDAKVNWWHQGWDKYIPTIVSTGTIYNPFYGDNLRCTGYIGRYGCITVWELKIDRWAGECEVSVESPVGTTLEAHISAVQNKMIGSCRVPYTYEFVTGKEEICIRLYSRGSFANATTSWLPFFLSSGGACGGVSGGGTLIPPITPPVLPASCSISDSITIGHGSINSASVNGSKASYNARLTCTRPVSVSVVVSNAGVIDLNATGTLSSTVYVAGKKGGNTFNNVSDMSVLFESILSMNDGASVSGKFERSAVVTVSII